MSSEIEFSLTDIKMLAGVEGIDVLIDGQKQATLQFGDAITFQVEAGKRTVQAVLHGMLVSTRRTLRSIRPMPMRNRWGMRIRAIRD